MNKKVHLIDIRTHRILNNMAGKPMEMGISKSNKQLKDQVLFNTQKSYKF